MPSSTFRDRRVALITGAGRGLGRAYALRLARAGVAVVVNDKGCDVTGKGLDSEPADQVVAEILEEGGVAVADFTDIGSFAGGSGVVENVLGEFERIDILVNNAGISGPASDGRDEDQWLDVLIAVHLKGTLGTMHAALPFMRKSGYGRIVNTVSEVALDMRMGPAGSYGIAKAAVWSATLSAAASCRGTGITVNGICPAARTRMNDVLYTEGEPTIDLAPDHVARVVEFLVSDGAGDISGHIVYAASDAVREYIVWRRGDTELVINLKESLGVR